MNYKEKYFSSWVATVLVLALLFILFLPILKWIVLSSQTPEYRVHFILLLIFSSSLILKKQNDLSKIKYFEFSITALLVFFIGLLGYVYSELFVSISLLSCIFFGVTVYGFLGFLVTKQTWRNYLPLVLLFFLCLPLSYHIEIFLGFPLRVLSTQVAEKILFYLGRHIDSIDTVLQINNNFTNVDLPCSGIKGLWAISIFLLILSIIDKYRINLNWLIVFFASWVFVVFANIFRIVVLIQISDLEHSLLLNQIFHVPLGVLGFVLACLLTYLLLKKLCNKFQQEQELTVRLFQQKTYCGICFSICLAIILNYSNLIKIESTRAITKEINSVDSIPLTEQEHVFFLQNGVLEYQKTKFNNFGLQGSAFLVLSNSWRGHHHPEQCLHASGNTIESSKTFLVRKNFYIRKVDIGSSRNKLVYWFQSIDNLTDDYTSRVWQGLIHPNKTFVMISLYLEDVNESDLGRLGELAYFFSEKVNIILNEREK